MSSRRKNESRANQTSSSHILEFFLLVCYLFNSRVMFPRIGNLRYKLCCLMLLDLTQFQAPKIPSISSMPLSCSTCSSRSDQLPRTTMWKGKPIASTLHVDDRHAKGEAMRSMKADWFASR
jgi:hypothetical protein